MISIWRPDSKRNRRPAAVLVGRQKRSVKSIATNPFRTVCRCVELRSNCKEENRCGDDQMKLRIANAIHQRHDTVVDFEVMPSTSITINRRCVRALSRLRNHNSSYYFQAHACDRDLRPFDDLYSRRVQMARRFRYILWQSTKERCCRVPIQSSSLKETNWKQLQYLDRNRCMADSYVRRQFLRPQHTVSLAVGNLDCN